MSVAEFLKTKKSLKGFNEEKDSDIITLDLGIMTQEHEHGVTIADSCCVDAMKDNFAWMRGHQNCWTGFPNDGKTQFTLFMMIMKSIRTGWKWVMWSPEMKSANFVDNKVKVHYNVLAYDIIATFTGKTPYRHIHEKFGVPMCTIDELHEVSDWIGKHFIFLDPKEKKITDIEKLLKRTYDKHGYDGILIDPFKNIEAEHNVRDDKHLHDVFSKFKDFAVQSNTVMNWIAHPKSGVSRVVKQQGNEVLVPCNQYMLAGGAAWDNSMDGIYSIQRPDALIDPTISTVAFHNLKQRMQHLTSERGVVTDINFNVKTRRYLFNDIDVLSNNTEPQPIKSFDKLPEVENNFETEETPF